MFAKLIRWVRKMLGLSINLTTTRVGDIGSIPAATGTASFMDGAGNTVTAPIVRQVLYINPGPFTPAATSYSYQVYSGGVAIPGESGSFTASGDPSYVVTDDQAGNTLSVKCYGVTASGQSPTTNDSAATSAVAAMSATSGITLITRTSASGVTPPVIEHTFASKVLPLDVVRVRESTDGTFSGADIVQDVVHFLTTTDLAGGAVVLDFVSDGFTTPGATSFLDYALEMTSPHGAFLSYTYPTTVPITDAVAAMVWNSGDKTAGITLSGGNLTALQSSAPGGCRTNRGITSGKRYWEIHMDAGACQVNLYDSSASLTVDQEVGFNGGTPSIHAAVYPPSNGFANFNTNFFAVTNIAASDTIGVAYDATNNLLWWAKNNTWQNSGNPGAGTGGLSTSGIGATVYPAVNMQNGNQVTANFGATAFAYTPPTGFVAP